MDVEATEAVKVAEAITIARDKVERMDVIYGALSIG
jgi:hypothetical protein